MSLAIQKFKRKSPDDVVAEAEEQGLEIIVTDPNSDWLCIAGDFAGLNLHVAYNTFNARFIVRIDEQLFTERNNELDDVPWYRAILNLVYGPEV